MIIASAVPAEFGCARPGHRHDKMASNKGDKHA
jgi:hypothetical protein